MSAPHTSQTLVTLAIPTYRRATLLARALESVARQDHAELDVLVADNASEGDEVRAVIDAFRDRLPGLRYVRHPANIGAVRNFMYCLDNARGEYFMWLADDDELAPRSLGHLIARLDGDASTVSVVPYWRLKRDNGPGTLVPQRVYESRSPVVRALRYVWRSNDAFYYALHRKAVLQRCRFIPFAWPNRDTVADLAYSYLLPLVLAGRVVAATDERVQWINHAYTEKSYANPEPFARYVIKHILRRVNLHAIYWGVVRRSLGWTAAALTVPVSAASLVVEVAGDALRKARRMATAAR